MNREISNYRVDKAIFKVDLICYVRRCRKISQFVSHCAEFMHNSARKNLCNIHTMLANIQHLS